MNLGQAFKATHDKIAEYWNDPAVRATFPQDVEDIKTTLHQLKCHAELMELEFDINLDKWASVEF